MARTFTARYRGRCRNGCGAIAVGDQIRRTRGGYAHVDCGWPGGEAEINAQELVDNGMSYKDVYGRCEDAPCCGCCGRGIGGYGMADVYRRMMDD